MRRALERATIGLAALAILAVPTFAAAKVTKWQKVKTWGWSAELPDGWKQRERKKHKSRIYAGTWSYVSPNRNWRVFVKVQKDEFKKFKDLAKDAYLSLFKRSQKLDLKRAKTITLNGRKLFYMAGGVKMKRKNKERQYVFLKFALRAPKRKLAVQATILSSEAKWDDFIDVASHFMDSFGLVDPESAKAQAKKLEKE